MRNLHQILLQEYGVEALCLFRDWERLWLTASDYKNHRIFTLRCLHKELIPVSIKLKSTLKTEKARKIIRKAEKDLLQARIKAINSILDNITKQTEECRSQLASIISAQRLRECQGFVDKVGEIRFTKVNQRQLNKYNILLNKKEGNITRANATTHPSNSASQAGRQASTLLPPREGSNLSQAGRQAVTSLPSGEGSNLTQAGTHLPSREVSSSPQAGRQAGTLLPSGEGSNLSQTNRQAGALLHPGEGSNSLQAGSQAGALLPLREGSISSQQLLTFPSEKEAVFPLQLLTLLPGKEAILPRQLLNFLLGKQAVPPRLLLTFPLGKQAVLPRQLLTFLLGKVTVLSSQPPFFPLGREVAFLRQAIKLGQAGKASGILPGIGHPRLPRGTALPPRQTALTPGKATPTLPSPVGFPKGLLMKNLTLSG